MRRVRRLSTTLSVARCLPGSEPTRRGITSSLIPIWHSELVLARPLGTLAALNVDGLSLRQPETARSSGDQEVAIASGLAISDGWQCQTNTSPREKSAV